MTRKKNRAAKFSQTSGVRKYSGKVRKGPAMKKIFIGLTFSFAGNFVAEKSDKWTYEKMANWIQEHGGSYEKEVTDHTTHLIVATHGDYRKKVPQVRKALQLGKRCHIVVHDWLEDCIVVANSKKKRRLKETGYTVSRVIRRGIKTKKEQELYRQQFEDGVRAGHELVDNRLHKVYCDPDGFEYKAVCTRVNIDGRVKKEKYTLYLFESIAKPSYYLFGAKLSSGNGRKPSYYRQDCHPKFFTPAFEDFKKYFHIKCGIKWDDRLEGPSLNPAHFRYDPPTDGRPVGMLPVGVLPPWERRPVDVSDSGVEGLTTDDYDSDSEVEDETESDATSQTFNTAPQSSPSPSVTAVSWSSDDDFNA